MGVGWDVHTDKPTLSLSFVGGFVQTLHDGGASYIHIRNSKFRDLQNFVMRVEAAFIESQTMPRDRAIGVCWWPGDDLGERFLLYEVGEYLGGTCHENKCPDFVNGRLEQIAVEQFVSVILIHQRGESAVYVDGMPVAYHKLSIATPSGGFSLCPHSLDGMQTDIKYDNLRVWSLP